MLRKISSVPPASRRPGDASQAFCAAAACGDAQSTHGGSPPTPIQVVTASARTIPNTIDTVGTLTSPEPTVVAAEVPGTVVYVDIAEGRRVRSEGGASELLHGIGYYTRNRAPE